MIFTWFERKKLVRQGLACDRTRRKITQADWLNFLETHPIIRALLFISFGLFVAALTMLESKTSPQELYILTSIVFGYAVLIMHLDLPEIWKSNSKVMLILLSIIINLSLTRGLYTWSQQQQSLPLLSASYLLPMTFAPLTITVLMGTRAGLYSVILDSLLDSLLLNQSFRLLLVNLLTGFTAVFFTRNVRRRGDLMRAGFAVGIASLICAVAVGLVSGKSQALLLQQGILSVIIGLVTAGAVNSALPVFESLFNITPEISWVEQADLNHPLLRLLTLQAPGTYHHSLMVANLAEAGATAIGANPTQCRVISYFHDIGKIPKAEYFSENIPAGEDPHGDLSPSMSALIIISHVKEGVDLAYKHRLKKPIIDAIQQHHGDSLVYYFYRRAKQQEADAKAGGKILQMREDDIPTVAESSFRYPGPRPQTKETAVLCLADAIESASRTLDKPNPQKIENLVNEIVDGKVIDHQLDDCPLSMRELTLLKESFCLTLKSMLHGRISYPKDERPTPSSQSPKRGTGSDPAAAA